MIFNPEMPDKLEDFTKINSFITRIVANNPSPFTYTGTCSYIIGQQEVVVLDPGPIDDNAHLKALLKAIGNRHLLGILVSHSHKDHSPLCRKLSEKTGAPILGAAPYERIAEDSPYSICNDSHDLEYQPDQVLNDGEFISGSDWALEVVTTPGHCANHLSFALKDTPYLFSVDHVMGWSTSIIVYPDGNMGDYINSLDKLLKRDEEIYLPGHGDIIKNGKQIAKNIKGHRLLREKIILEKLELLGQDANLEKLVAAVYSNLKPSLVGAATLSTLAHLGKLKDEGNIGARKIIDSLHI